MATRKATKERTGQVADIRPFYEFYWVGRPREPKEWESQNPNLEYIDFAWSAGFLHEIDKAATERWKRSVRLRDEASGNYIWFRTKKALNTFTQELLQLGPQPSDPDSRVEWEGERLGLLYEYACAFTTRDTKRTTRPPIPPVQRSSQPDAPSPWDVQVPLH